MVTGFKNESAEAAYVGSNLSTFGSHCNPSLSQHVGSHVMSSPVYLKL